MTYLKENYSMKRIIALLLALILCFAMLVSCGDDDESSSSSSGESQSEQGGGGQVDLEGIGDLPNDPNVPGDNEMGPFDK